MARLSTTLAGAAFGAAFLALALPSLTPAISAEPAISMLPAPMTDVAPGPGGLQTAVFAGGCFWGVQGVFQHVKGVTQAVSGYAGGNVADPGYERVSSGDHRPRGGGPRDLRSGPRQLRQAAADLLLGGARPDAGERAGARLRHAVPLRAVRRDGPDQDRVAQRLHRPARRGARLQPADRHPGGPRRAVLPGRGLPPGLPRCTPGRSPTSPSTTCPRSGTWKRRSPVNGAARRRPSAGWPRSASAGR